MQALYANGAKYKFAHKTLIFIFIFIFWLFRGKRQGILPRLQSQNPEFDIVEVGREPSMESFNWRALNQLIVPINRTTMTRSPLGMHSSVNTWKR